MRIPTGSTDRYIYFVAVDSTDFTTRETGLTTFTVYRSRNGAAAAAMTTPTINETDVTNMPGVYELLLDEDTTLAAGKDTEEMVLHITQASMAPVTRTVEIYRPETTEGTTLGVTAGACDNVTTVATTTTNTDMVAAAPTAASIADAVWDELQADHTTVGTFGVTASEIASILVDTAQIGTAGAGLTAIAWNAAWDAEVQSEVNDGLVAFFTSSAQLVDDVWDEALTGGSHNVVNSAGRRLRNVQDFGIYDLASVWVDEVAGSSTGTTDGEDATVTNRANDFDNAQTVAASVGLDRIHVQSGNTITLTATLNGYKIWGTLYTVALGGQDIGNTDFDGCTVSGIGIGTTPAFDDCFIGTATLPPATFNRCNFTSTLTIGSAGDYRLIRCQSGVAGASAPVIDMGAAVGGTTLELRDWRGGITLNNLAAGDVVSLDGIFGTITLNGADATVEIRGIWKAVTNNLTGSPAVTLSGVEGTEIASILADTNELQSDDVPGLIAALNDIAATDIVSAGAITTLAGAVVNVDLVDTCTTNTDMVAAAPTAAAVADQVWDEAIADHAGVGSTGEALSAAGSAGDPWSTALPGAYGAGTAGNILGNNLDAVLSARTLAAASYFDPATDTVANVTTVATTTTNTDMLLTTQIAEAVLTSDLLDPTWGPMTPGESSRWFILNAAGINITTIATLASQTSFTLTAGSAGNDAYNGCIIVIENDAAATQKAVGIVSDYVGSTKTVTLESDPGIFTMGVGDVVTIKPRRADLLPATQASIDAIEADTSELQTDDYPTTLATLATSAALATAQADLDIITGASGVNLLTATQASIDAIEADSNELQTDWADGGRLDLILDTASGTSGSSGSVLTVTLSDDSANLVDGSQVYLQTSAGVMLGVYDTTGPASGNASGQVVLTYPDGSYLLKVGDRSGYETHTAESVTISGATSKAITVTASVGVSGGRQWVG